MASDREPDVSITDRLDKQKKKEGILSFEEHLEAATLLDDAKIATLRDQWIRSGDPVEQKRVAAQIQQQGYESVPYIPVGQFQRPRNCPSREGRIMLGEDKGGVRVRAY